MCTSIEGRDLSMVFVQFLENQVIFNIRSFKKNLLEKFAFKKSLLYLACLLYVSAHLWILGVNTY